MSDDLCVTATPPVHVERSAAGASVAWRAGPLTRALGAVRDSPVLPSGATAVVDDRSVAGRRRRTLADATATGSVVYLRVESSAPWTVAWERRTDPVVVVTGRPAPATVRVLHRATTDGPDDGGWDDDARAALAAALPD